MKREKEIIKEIKKDKYPKIKIYKGDLKCTNDWSQLNKPTPSKEKIIIKEIKRIRDIHKTWLDIKGQSEYALGGKNVCEDLLRFIKENKTTKVVRKFNKNK